MRAFGTNVPAHRVTPVGKAAARRLLGEDSSLQWERRMMVEYKGTYSPDDDRLRLYVRGDPDPDIRERAKNGGFAWSAKQRAFVAPKWTPEREDLLLQLCGEIGDELGDEDGSLVGQAERYSRRIRTIEADKRKHEQVRFESAKLLKTWQDEILTLDQATVIASRDRLHVRLEGDSASVRSVWSGLVRRAISLEEARSASIRAHEMAIARAQRWIDHYEKRLTRERAVLAKAGGAGADLAVPEVGGGCQYAASPSGKWWYIRRVNKVSVTVFDTWEKGRTFPRTIPFRKLSRLIGAAEIETARTSGRLIEARDGTGFVLREAILSNGDGVSVTAAQGSSRNEEPPTNGAIGAKRFTTDVARRCKSFVE